MNDTSFLVPIKHITTAYMWPFTAPCIVVNHFGSQRGMLAGLH